MVKIKLADINHILEVDDLLEGCEPNQAQVDPPVSTSSSDCPDSPAEFTHPSGKFTLVTPSPGPLEWGCNPSALHEWFQSCRDYWSVNWTGGVSNEKQLIKLMKVNLAEEWKMALSDFD